MILTVTTCLTLLFFAATADAIEPRTRISIVGDAFHINDQPTYASWGYFDYRMQGGGFDEGYQSAPVNWGISSARKRGFFHLLSEITGAKP
jgi:hypothetical protein